MNYCKVCVKQKICPAFNFNPFGCANFSQIDNVCGWCGRPVDSHAIYLINEDDSNQIICNDCLKLKGTCVTCINGDACEFETNPSTIPKTIQKPQYLGGATVISTEKNPERIKLLCKTCSCYDEQLGCLKELRECKNWKCIK